MFKYDYNHAIVLNETNHDLNINIQHEIYRVNSSFLLEKNEFDNEVMFTLCSLIYHMANMNNPSYSSSKEEFSKLIKSINTILNDKNKHSNIRIFLTKIIINLEDIFHHYKDDLLLPLMKIILDQCAGTKLNYFYLDILYIVLKWGNIQLKNDFEKDIINKLFEFLYNNIFNYNIDIFELNLEILKTFVELWKTELNLPFDYFLEKLRSSKTLEIEIILHISSILLANQLLPWNEKTQTLYLNELTNKLISFSASISNIAAHILGMGMKILSQNHNQNLEWIDIVKNKILEFPYSKLITTLELIQCNFESFADSIIYKLVFMLPSLPGTFKFLCLKILYSRFDILSNFFRENLHNILKNNGLCSFICDMNENIQELGLEILLKLIHLDKEENLPEYIDEILNISTNSKSKSRYLWLEIIITIFNKIYASTSLVEINEKLKSLMIIGICEEENFMDEFFK